MKITLEDFRIAVENMYYSLNEQGYSKENGLIDYANIEIQEICVDIINNLGNYYERDGIYKKSNNMLITDSITKVVYPLLTFDTELYNYCCDNIQEIYEYEIVVCNLGYDDVFLCALDGKKFNTPEKAFESIIEVVDLDNDFIEGFEIIEKIDKLSKLPEIFDYFKKNEEILTIIRTEEYNRCIYIRKI